MIDHSGLSVTNFAAAQSFYDAVFAPLGAGLLMMVPAEHTGGVKVAGYGRDRPVFWLSEGQAQTPPIHIAFKARSRAEVDAFHTAALAAGGSDNGAPGLRPHYGAAYYAAFVRDAEGNNIEAVYDESRNGA